ncbi:HlyIII-domain-containing protein [Pleurotus eryngii]|uniref:HlyIII-domain-containing protein n=1 Tax=Pleurotus eryngii TaxID=5323 RepID=A0A9P6DF88_PLEER|nr:HlyIII-domain-containing protein [Pleurotus eryngii]
MTSLRQRAPFASGSTATVTHLRDVAAEVHKLTLEWLEIPEWQRDNEYILTGYRRVQHHWRGCVHSVYAYLHNETVNIHSHLWGAVLFGYLLLTFYPNYVAHQHGASWIDVTVFAIFLVSAVFCLLASATLHAFTCHSPKIALRCHVLDYSGIVVLIVGSFYPCIYYGFFCHRFSQVVYLSGITIIGIGAAYIVLNPKYAQPSHRGARTAVFVALGLSAVIPVSHGLLSHGVNKMMSEMGFGWLVLSGALYLAGALLYANRIPERLSPGKFDYFFASHQIFHCFVVLAALAHYLCVLTAFDHWHSQQLVCST